MEARTETAVVAAINTACETAKAGLRLYDTVCEVPGVLDARQRRGLFGLGKRQVGNPSDADHDYVTTDLLLNFIGGSGMSTEVRYNLFSNLSQEVLARPAPQPCRPLASTDDITLCLALDAAVHIRSNIGFALGVANLDVALEWAQEGDHEANRAIPIRLLLDSHAPVGLAISATRIAMRVFVNSHRTHLMAGVSGQQWAAVYDSMIAAAGSDIQRMMASIRADVGSTTLDPTPASTAPYLAKEFATIAHNVAEEVNARSNSVTDSIAESASTVASLASETAAAYDTAIKAILP